MSIDFDDLEENEHKQIREEERLAGEHRARQQQEEEELRRKRFYRDLELEEIIDKRVTIGEDQDVHWTQGVVGVMVDIPFVRNGKKGQHLFVNAMNDTLASLWHEFKQHSFSEHPGLDLGHRIVVAIVHFLNVLVQQRFQHSEATTNFEKLYTAFSRPNQGLSALVEEMFSGSLATPERYELFRQTWAAALDQILVGFEQILDCMITWTEQDTKALEEGCAALRTWILPGSCRSIAKPNAEAKARVSSAQEKALQMLEELISAFGSSEYQQKLHTAWLEAPSESAVAIHLEAAAPILQRYGFKCNIQGLVMADEALNEHKNNPDVAAKRDRLEWLMTPARQTRDQQSSQLTGQLNSLNLEEQPVEGGIKAPMENSMKNTEGAIFDWIKDKMEDLFKIINYTHLPNDNVTWRSGNFCERWRIMKTNIISMTRLLDKLRAEYQRNEFQQQYKELRRYTRPGQPTHVDCALDVQKAVLPAYGFAGNICGVNEMRGEVCILEARDAAVEKLKHDIHRILDFGEPLQRLPITKALECERLPLHEKSKWLRHLADEGYVVIEGAVDVNEVGQAYNLLWDFIEKSDTTGMVQRRWVESWVDSHKANCGWPADRDDGIIHNRGIGQSEVMWYLRSLPAIQEVFQSIWGTKQLVTSLDGAGVFRPYAQNPSWKTTKKNWFHVDQAHKRKGLHCIQGLVTLKDATEKTGGLVVVPRSHRLFSDVLSRYPEKEEEDTGVKLNLNDPVLTEGGDGPKMLCAKAGDLLIWDSRTVHCNTPPLVDDYKVLTEPDLLRAVAYICMTPAAWMSTNTAELREKAFILGATTTHLPHHFRMMSTAEDPPPGKLTPAHKELLCPSARKEVNMKPGGISFLPTERFRVTSEKALVREKATLEWGHVLGVLDKGMQVSGYVFGEWLRLESIPKHWTKRDLNADMEAWVLIDGRIWNVPQLLEALN